MMNLFTILLMGSFFSVSGCTPSDKTNEVSTVKTMAANGTLTSSTDNTAEIIPPANETTNNTEAKPTVALAPDHVLFDQLLKKYVSTSGVVDYKGLKTKEADLDKYLAEMAKEIPTSKWSRNASLAYWINAYNAATLKLILKNYPVKSIQDINSGKPWDLKWINLGGKTYTLNNIENDIIRPTYKDPRIHFALVCAAKSCPPLLNEAFTETNVDRLLDARAKNFINSPANDISASKLNVVKIFDWYQADFGNVISFLNKFSNTKINPGASISYKEYDWSLNGK